MKLTEYDLDEYTLPDDVSKQILKNQKMCEYYEKFDTEHDMLKVLEKAEKWDNLEERPMVEYMEYEIIVERLKKRIEELKITSGEPIPDLLSQLQKIMEGDDGYPMNQNNITNVDKIEFKEGKE